MGKKPDAEPSGPRDWGLPKYEHNFVVAIEKQGERNCFKDLDGGYDSQRTAEADAGKLAQEAGRRTMVWSNLQGGVVARFEADGQKVEGYWKNADQLPQAPKPTRKGKK